MPNTVATLETFLSVGRLGSIRCGIKRQRVESLLGLAEVIEEYPGGHSMWGYGCLELRFLENCLVLFGLYIHSGNALPTVLNAEGFFPVKETPMSEMRRFVRTAGVGFERAKDRRKLRTQGGVWILPTLHNTVLSLITELAGPTAYLDEYFSLPGG